MINRCTWTCCYDLNRDTDLDSRGATNILSHICDSLLTDIQNRTSFMMKLANQRPKRWCEKCLWLCESSQLMCCVYAQIVLEDNQKFLKLLELLGVYQERGAVLVFVHKQEHADELMKNLLRHSYACMSLHGGIDQYDRDSIMNDFKAGNVKLLVSGHYFAPVKECGLTVRLSFRGWSPQKKYFTTNLTCFRTIWQNPRGSSPPPPKKNMWYHTVISHWLFWVLFKSIQVWSWAPAKGVPRVDDPL